MSAIAQNLARLSVAAEDLNASTEALNSVVAAVDAQLREMSVGVSFWDSELLARESAGRRGQVRLSFGWRLGYAKLSDGWRLAAQRMQVEQGHVDGDASAPYENQDACGDPVALLTAPRVVRVEAMERLEDFLAGFADRVDDFVDGIQRAVQLPVGGAPKAASALRVDHESRNGSA